MRIIFVKGFEALFKMLKNELLREKIVIVFDEFPYLIEIDRGIVSVFQKFGARF